MLNIFSTVGLTIGAHTSADAPSRSARTAAMIASSIVEAAYSRTTTLSPSIKICLSVMRSSTGRAAMTAIKFFSVPPSFRIVCTIRRSVFTFGSRRPSSILYIVLCGIEAHSLNSRTVMPSSSFIALESTLRNRSSDSNTEWITPSANASGVDACVIMQWYNVSMRSYTFT